MRTLKLLVVGLMAFWMIFAPAVNPETVHAQGKKSFAPGEILVKFKPGTPAAEITKTHRQNGGVLKQTIAKIDVHVVGVPRGQEEAQVALYGRNPNVLFAEPNSEYHATWVPNDSLVNQQWQYNNVGQTGGTIDADIDAFEAWNVTIGSSSVPIAVLDTGVDPTHEDLVGKVTKSANFSDSDTVNDIQGHGTHVAGSAAANSNNGKGVAGTCPNCTVYNGKVLGDNGRGYLSWAANGIIWAADNGAKVINMSLGCEGCPNTTLQQAIDYAWGKGVVVVAAAGNNSTSNLFYPASYPNVIAVAATDHTDNLAFFSNYGDWVDVAAPGESILSSTRGNGYEAWNGTSMASPHVAGLAGLVWSTGACGTDTACVRSRIETKADRIAGTGTYWTYGRINAYNSVVSLANPTPKTTSISPSERTAGSSGNFTLTVTGSDFVSGSKVFWNGSERPTTHDSSTQLRATISSSDVATPGVKNVTVVTPAPGGGTSNPQRFTVLYPNRVQNPGFESDTNADTRPDVWSTNSRVTRSSALKRSGSYSMRHSATDNGSYSIYQVVYDITPGTLYNFSAWTNIPATSDTFSFKWEVAWKNSSSTVIGTVPVFTYSAQTSGWNNATAALLVPDGTTHAVLRMVVSSLNATIYADDVSFKPVVNLLENAGFETDADANSRPDNWSSDSRMTRSSTLKRSGTYAARHSATDNSSYAAFQSMTNLTAGATYNFSGWVNIPATSDTFTFKWEVRWRDASGNILTTTTLKTYSAQTSGWNGTTATVTAPTGTTQATIRMSVGSLNATIYADDVVFGR